MLGVSVYTTEGSERHRFVAGPDIVTTPQHTQKQNTTLTVSETGKYMTVQKPKIEIIITSAGLSMKQHVYITVQIQKHSGITQEMEILLLLLLLLLLVVVVVVGRSQNTTQLRSVPLLIPTPVHARCFDHSQYSHVKALRYFNVRSRRRGALRCSVSTAVQTVDLPEPNRNLRHFDSVERPVQRPRLLFR